jgi:hypothetical protein
MFYDYHDEYGDEEYREYGDDEEYSDDFDNESFDGDEVNDNTYTNKISAIRNIYKLARDTSIILLETENNVRLYAIKNPKTPSKNHILATAIPPINLTRKTNDCRQSK